jgi:hypothetical protein
MHENCLLRMCDHIVVELCLSAITLDGEQVLSNIQTHSHEQMSNIFRRWGCNYVSHV